MRRYPAFDPPEYVDWSPDPELQRRYRDRLAEDPERAEIVASVTREGLIALYRDLLRTRLHDVMLARWVRGGVISKAWLGTGEEAVTVGSVGALRRDRDVVCPMIRNAGALHMMGMPLADMLRGYLATRDSPTGGRDIHIGDRSIGVVQPVSIMGTSVSVMAGVALAFRRGYGRDAGKSAGDGRDRVALTWVGDGATRTAAFHEGINFAAVQRLPVIIVIQNNQVALGTRLEQHGAGDVGDIPAAYGLEGLEADGNNVLDLLAATRIARRRCTAGDGPAVIVAETFRMGGHATHDEREARETFASELFEEWGRRDPIGMYESYLLERGFDRELLEAVEEDVVAELDRAAEEALESRGLLPEPTDALYPGFSEGGPLVGLEKRPI